jgi:hypothetical protein
MTRAERVLLVRALARVCLFRLLLPFAPLRALLRLAGGAARPKPASFSAEAVAWSVRAAASRVPGTRCLARSLALQALLRRSGHEASLRIGVRREGAALEAHAWVACDARPIDDEPGTGTYAAFEPLPR